MEGALAQGAGRVERPRDSGRFSLHSTRKLAAPRMTLPNLITIARLLLVPLVVVAINSGQWGVAFVVFAAAGASDAVDGFLARRLNMRSELGAYLDDDLWLNNARHANDMATRLRDGLAGLPGVKILSKSGANILFCHFPDHLSADLRAQGYAFYGDRWEPGVVRFVTSFAHHSSDIDTLVSSVTELTRGYRSVL